MKTTQSSPRARRLILPFLAVAVCFVVSLTGCGHSVVIWDGAGAPYHPGDPPQVGRTQYRIRKGDTLYAIAVMFDLEWQELVTANPWLDPDNLQPGDVITIPQKSRRPEPPVVLRPKPVPDPLPDSGRGEDPAQAVPASEGHAGPLPAERDFIWPLRGELIARFDQPVAWRRWERNRGIDIRAAEQQLIVAAKSGRVNTFEEVPGYGRVVVLEHSDGATTFYGHLDSVLVPHGRWAKQGEGIGTVGTSSHARGTELHFRIAKGDEFVDPLSVLPR